MIDENDSMNLDDQHDDSPEFETNIVEEERVDVHPTVDLNVAELHLESEPVNISDNYNSSTTDIPGNPDDEKEVGSCDCRSECKYHTGKTWKYADYGYSD